MLDLGGMYVRWFLEEMVSVDNYKIIISLLILLVTNLLKISQEEALVYSGINPYRLYYDLVELNLIYVLIFVILVPWLYYSLFESSNKQATPGKMILGIVVVNLSGEKVSFFQATIRYFGKYLSSLIIYIGFLMAAFTKRKQALHDVLARTLIVVKNNY